MIITRRIRYFWIYQYTFDRFLLYVGIFLSLIPENIRTFAICTVYQRYQATAPREKQIKDEKKYFKKFRFRNFLILSPHVWSNIHKMLLKRRRYIYVDISSCNETYRQRWNIIFFISLSEYVDSLLSHSQIFV